MKVPNTANEAVESASAVIRRLRYRCDEADQWSLAHKDHTAAANESTTAGIAKYMNVVQVIMVCVLSVSSIKIKQSFSPVHQ